MKSKVLILLLCMVFQSFVSSAQVSLAVIPDTPLDYFVFELTEPSLKVGYNKRTQYSEMATPSLTEEINVIKYSDLPLYSYYSVSIFNIVNIESKTTISRTAHYVAYLFYVRNNSSDKFVLYSKDTFFLKGNSITKISETIYNTNNNSKKSYAKYSVVYHANGKIDHIKLNSVVPIQSYGVFGGVQCVYNTNNTLNRDTIYDYSFSNVNKLVMVSKYQDFVYKITDDNQIDSIIHYDMGHTKKLDTKFTFELDENNEVTTQNGLTFDFGDFYQQTYYYTFEVASTLSIISKNNVKTFQPYPNPTSDRIQIPDNIHGKEWSIYSASGMLMNQGVGNVQEWNVSNYEKGMYILQITDGETSWQGKFIVK